MIEAPLSGHGWLRVMVRDGLSACKAALRRQVFWGVYAFF